MARFMIGDVAFTFISSHLAAHEGEDFCKRRNEDARDILKATSAVAGGREDVASPVPHAPSYTPPQATPKIHADAAATSHHVFWVGDLNYRMKLDELAACRPGEKKKPSP